MVTLNKLQEYLDALMKYDPKMDMSKIDPHMSNGLMVKGKEEIKRVGFGVSASLELFKLAKKEKCDAVIVHHAFQLPSFNRYEKIFQNRIGFLMTNDISLFGYHFLLDSHPETGNNIQILETIGAVADKPYLHHGDPWGWSGKFEKETDLKTILSNLQPYLSKRLTVYEFGPEKIKKAVAVSGMGAPRDMQELIDKEIDLYITGEVHEWNREMFREAGIHFIAGGHYNTEVFGLRALMDKITEKFPSIETIWLKLNNEI